MGFGHLLATSRPTCGPPEPPPASELRSVAAASSTARESGSHQRRRQADGGSDGLTPTIIVRPDPALRTWSPCCRMSCRHDTCVTALVGDLDITYNLACRTEKPVYPRRAPIDPGGLPDLQLAGINELLRLALSGPAVPPEPGHRDRSAPTPPDRPSPDRPATL